MRRNGAEARHAIDHVDGKMEPIDLVEHAHIERRGGGAFFLVPAHVQLLVGAPVGEAVNQPGVAVVVEDDLLVFREQGIVFAGREGRAGVRWPAAGSSDRRR